MVNASKKFILLVTVFVLMAFSFNVSAAEATNQMSTVTEAFDFKVKTEFTPSTLAPNQVIGANVTAENVSKVPYGDVKNVLLIVALYNKNNTMLNVSYLSKGIAYKGTETLSAGFKLPSDVTGCHVRSFIWDGTSITTSKMIPYSNVEEIPEETKSPQPTPIPTPTADSPNYSLYIDDHLITTDAPLREINNDLYAPISVFASGFGYSVSSDAANQQINIKSSKDTLTAVLGSKDYVFNRETVNTELPPVLYSARVFVPLQFVAEKFGCTISSGLSGTDIHIKKPGNVFMWEVSPADSASSKRVYILGSIHAGNKDAFPLDQRIEDCFGKSDTLVVEADTSKVTQEAYTGFISKYGTYPENVTLKDKIPATLYNKLETELQKMGVPMNDNIYKAKPWLLDSQITSLKLMQGGYDPSLGIDLYFMNKTKSEKPVLELESLDFQYRLLSSFSDNLQAANLESTLNTTVETMNDSVDMMYKYWKNGDTKGIESVVFTNSYSSKELFDESIEKMFYQRNVGMANKIVEYLKDDKTYFVIAGSGHMVGDKGVIDLLISKGYKVKQL